MLRTWGVLHEGGEFGGGRGTLGWRCIRQPLFQAGVRMKGRIRKIDREQAWLSHGRKGQGFIAVVEWSSWGQHRGDGRCVRA